MKTYLVELDAQARDFLIETLYIRSSNIKDQRDPDLASCSLLVEVLRAGKLVKKPRGCHGRKP